MRSICREAVGASAWVLLTACGGGGGSGQAMTSPTIFYPTPIVVSQTLNFAAIESSGQHACGIAADGSTWCWGDDSNGQLGPAVAASVCNGTACSGTPLQLSTGLQFVTLTASLGEGLTCGLVATGEAYCWGFGLGGQLGNGQQVSSSTPVAVAGGRQFRFLRLHPSSLGACGQTANGSIYCWGPLGLLYGNGQSGEGHSTPTKVNWGTTLVDFDLGDLHACGVSTVGDAYCWGNNFNGLLGIGSVGAQGGVAQATTPQKVLAISELINVVTGSDESCALDRTGQAFCWGVGNHSGSALVGAYAATPVKVDGNVRFSSLHAGFSQTCGLTADGGVYCWGSNLEGALGDGTQINSQIPVKVQTSATFTALSRRASCGVATGGVGYCWGGNDFGQVGRPP